MKTLLTALILNFLLNWHFSKIYGQQFENCGFEAVERSFKTDSYTKKISDQITFIVRPNGIRYNDEDTPFSLMLHFYSSIPIIEDNSHISIKLENGKVLTKNSRVSTSVIGSNFVCFGHFYFSAIEVNILRSEMITDIEMDILKVKLNNNKSNRIKDTFNCLFP